MRRRRIGLASLTLAAAGFLATGLVTTGHGDAAPHRVRAVARADRAVAPPCPVPRGLRELFARASERAGLEPALLVAVAQAESQLDAAAVSARGARGLLQLMPETARALRVRIDSPAENLAGGARYLRQLIDRFGSLSLALAAYNAGPTTVAAYGQVPPFEETERYVLEVTITRRALTGCRFRG